MSPFTVLTRGITLIRYSNMSNEIKKSQKRKGKGKIRHIIFPPPPHLRLHGFLSTPKPRIIPHTPTVHRVTDFQVA
ncbi:hypothetical protein BTUL_0053g00250 [Botrytis tulipae]|uniref:Uncharacterized protein n=1 Tax=Botrytis tulipae TaxID=87230 RepID=A0A4Z1EQ06_9HELO|nr:hypothetical protein BTUL_0053g00250 [Botrytis tulipae]